MGTAAAITEDLQNAVNCFLSKLRDPRLFFCAPETNTRVDSVKTVKARAACDYFALASRASSALSASSSSTFAQSITFNEMGHTARALRT